ncbi:MAG: YihY/virulence factor BrkB family protein [Anaerolineales bacterium]|nr:YihY/virulence factor BrkB family protein [Anaerolineales bacterium]
MNKALHKLRANLLNLANRISRGWGLIFWNALQHTFRPETSVKASAIAYFALFSLFPLILLSIAIASVRFGQNIDQHIIMRQMEFLAPALSQLLGDNIDQIIQARRTVSGVAALGLVWSASSVFYTLTHTLNEIWHREKKRATWKARGLAILVVLAFIGPALFLITLAGSVLANLHFWIPDQILPLQSSISFGLTILLDMVLFMALYRLLPHGTSTWRETLPGAIGGGALWELAKKLFLAFVSTYISISNLVYGAVAVIIAFLIWAYLSSLIFLFGAYLNLAYCQSHDRSTSA